MMESSTCKKPEGKLGVLLPGMGAVSTTFIAGVMLVREGKGVPFGSLSQLLKIKFDTEHKKLNEVVPLANLNDLCFGGWDIFDENAYQTAVSAQVIPIEKLDIVRDQMMAINPWPAVFSKDYIRNIDGPNVKQGSSKMDFAEQIMRDIQNFKERNSLSRLVMCWCGSTEIYHNHTDHEAFQSLQAFESALKESQPLIPPSMIYAYAALKMGVPYANGAPNLSVDVPALLELALKMGVPIAGKDFKTGQTLLKTIIAPGLKAKMLGLEGWYSGNILGNRDGLVLADPDSFKSKEVTKESVLETILTPEIYPELYKDYYHKVRIEYYPPRGDSKEGWDTIDIKGWLGEQMQIKINFLCKDSILAAPVVLDVVLFLDLAHRAGFSGIQDWLSLFFKSPMCEKNGKPVNDVFTQSNNLHKKLLSLIDH